LDAAGYTASSSDRHLTHGPEGYQIQATPDGGVLVRHVAIGDDVNGVTPSGRVSQMLTEYGHALRGAGFQVTSAAGASLAVTLRPAGRRSPALASPGQDNNEQASHAAAAADEAYRAGNLDRARQLTDRAAELDPSRSELWEQHRAEIAAKRLFREAQAAHADGEHGQAHTLIENARQLDPRMQMMWTRHLTGAHLGQQARHAHGPGTGRDQEPGRHDVQPAARSDDAGAKTGLQQPGRPAHGRNRVPRIPGGRGDGPGSPGLAARDTTQRPSAAPEDAARPPRAEPVGARQPGLPHRAAGGARSAGIQAGADGGDPASNRPGARLDAEPAGHHRGLGGHPARQGAGRAAGAAQPAHDGQIGTAGAGDELDAGRLRPDLDSRVHAAGPANAFGYRYPEHLAGPPAASCPPSPRADGPEIGG
jgi:hypothetical protein